MIKEWNDWANSFNSEKGLTYIEHYKAIDEWRRGLRSSPYPPIEISMDIASVCQLRCAHCFSGEELINLSDFTYKKIKDLKKGDKVLGLKNNKIVSNKVLNVFNNGKTNILLKFTFEDGDTFECTPEHKIWKTKNVNNVAYSRWVKASGFKENEYVKKAFRFNRHIENNMDYIKGYISGMASGDGCCWLNKNKNGTKSYRFRLFLYDIEAMNIFGKYCSILNIKWHWGFHQYNGHKDYQKHLKFKKKALWITSDKEAKKIKELMNLCLNTSSFKIGWIAGIFDAEGSASKVIRISQFNENIKNKIWQYCLDLKYNIIKEPRGIRLRGRGYDKLNFFLDHNIKIKRKMSQTLSQKIYSIKKIVKIEQIQGNFVKYDIETETNNYLIKGVLVHNCNYGKYFDSNKKSIMPKDHIFNLVTFFANWQIEKYKVRGICWGGGGDSTLNPYLAEALLLSYGLGMENSIATNGINFGDKLIEAAAKACRWIGISVDAATEKTYNIGRRGDYFNIALANIKKLVNKTNELKVNNDIGFKFLIFDYNQHEIYEACKIAKDLGVKDYHCFPKDTFVLMANGEFKSIETIEKNEEIINGKLAKIDNILRRPYNESIIKIKAKFLPELVCTPEHPIYIGTFGMKNSKKYLKNREFKKANEIKKYSKNKDSEAFIIPKNILKSEPTFFNFSNYLNKRKLGRKKDKQFLQPIKLTEEWAELFGWYVAEGSRGSKLRSCIAFSLSKKEKNNINRICFLIKKLLNRKPHVQYIKNTAGIKFSSHILYSALPDLFGNNSHNKKIPSFIMFSEKNIAKAFLNAYFKGDGTTKPGKYGDVSLSTVSKQLIYQAQILFLKIGLITGFNTVPEKTSSINGKIVKGGISYRLYWNINRKTKQYIEDKDYYYFPIVDIKLDKFNGMVYNLSTSNSIYAIPYLVHNCRPCDFGHQGVKEIKSNPYNIDLIKEQFEKCHSIEDENFRVFTVVHKYNEDFTPKRNFSQCYASSLCLQICPEKNIFLCPDTRQLEFFKMGEHYPDPKEILNIWGKELHYNLVFKSGCSNCNSRCTFSKYNEQCQRLAINKDDPMCLSFV